MKKIQVTLLVVSLMSFVALTAIGCAQTGSGTIGADNMETSMDRMNEEKMGGGMEKSMDRMGEEKMDESMKKDMQDNMK